MKPEEQRIAIAEACGWKWVPHPITNSGGYWELGNLGRLGYQRGDWGSRELAVGLPDYLTDLNAMHEAEKALPKDMKTDYVRHLNKGDFANYRLAFATAAQRAEAFLKTLNLWTTHPTKGPK